MSVAGTGPGYGVITNQVSESLWDFEYGTYTENCGPFTYSFYVDGGPPPDPDPPPGQCSVSGTVFVDHNRNGAFDASDAPVSGTMVYLTDSADTYVIDTFITGSSGSYEFGGLEEGGYRVIHPVPSGYVNTTDDSVPFSACSFSHNFGITPDSPAGQGTASGVVFFDYNYNGVFDESEDPVSGTTVYLTDRDDTYVISTYTTGSSGGYQFQGLQEGSYRVKHPVPNGYVKTTDDSIAFSAANFVHNFGIAQDPQPPCTVYPPLLRTRRGVEAGRVYRYFVGGGLDANEQSADSRGIKEVFDRWTAANATTGVNASFVRSFDPAVWDIMLVKQRLATPLIPAAIGQDVQTTPSGHWHRGTVIYNSRWNSTNEFPLVSNQDAVRRLGLHEAGHIHGLDDVPNAENEQARSSVMLTDITRGDRFYRRIPDNPTACDAAQADLATGN